MAGKGLAAWRFPIAGFDPALGSCLFVTSICLRSSCEIAADFRYP